ncbi:acetate--CoA ligase family protein [Rhodobacteraceae bacterium]|nr:acetate--CoA ligase family protein [Paracoccaceae bacterium]
MRNLSRLFAPRSIVVVGGGVWCANAVKECVKIGFEGSVLRVHPYEEGAFRSVADLPAVPDAVFIGVNRDVTVEVVRNLAAMGAGGAVCFASGFSEAERELAGGTGLQAALLEAAGDMPVLGPNCYGVLNLLDGAALWPDQHGAVRVDAGVAIIAQSSNVAINLTMQRRGLPLAYVVTVGNQAQTDMAEIGAALLDDDRVTALGLYVEGIRDLRRFEALATKARAGGKSIVALKVGASDQAQAAAVSHTASLAGNAAGAAALFDRLGIAQVTTLGAFLETLKVLHVTGPLSSNRIASMSCSGGEASLVADSALATGLVFPPLEVDQARALADTLGSKVALANPLDYHTYIWGDLAAMTACFAAMMQGDLALGMVILDFPKPEACDISEWRLVIDAVVAAQSLCQRPMAIVSSLPETFPEEIALECIAKGILPLAGLADALSALDAAQWLGLGRRTSTPLLLPGSAGPGFTLSEVDAKFALAKHGLSVPQGAVARTSITAGQAARQLGFPVVLKAGGMAHKSDWGGVIVNLGTVVDVEDAARNMDAASFLIESMVEGGIAELLIGVIADPAHGFVLTLGAGGILTELLDDTVSLLLPVTGDDVKIALGLLRTAPVLRGYRGGQQVDIETIIDAILAVQSYVTQHQDTVLEVEVNPLIVTPNSAVAADALIRLKEPT